MPDHHADIAETGAHSQTSSTGTADIKTVTAPARATGVYLTVTTTPIRVVFDGSTPSTTNGIRIDVTTTDPVYLPLGRSFKFASNTAAASIVDALWIT